MSIAGMILGIIATIFAFIPVVGAFIAIPCLAVGLPLATVDFFRKKNRGEGFGMAIAGIVLNICALAITIIWIGLIAGSVD